MAVIDLKETIIRLWAGELRTYQSDSVAANSDLDWTEASTHFGSYPPSITLVDPMTMSAALSIVVTGRDIVVNLATDAVPAITSTANDIKTAIDADPVASTLVTVTVEGDGTGIVDAHAEASLAGTKNALQINIGEGNMTFDEKSPVEFIRNRGLLVAGGVRNADDEPMDFSLDIQWDFLSSVAGATVPTPREAIAFEGPASAWLTTADDPCQPKCLDIELLNQPGCTGIEDESIVLEEAYFESQNHDLRGGTVAGSGRCNRKRATAIRIPA